MHKYWKEVMFGNEIIAELSIDGLLYRFKVGDIVPLLKNLPSNEIGWFFNATMDRYCAERTDGDYVIVNPAKVLELLGMPVID